MIPRSKETQNSIPSSNIFFRSSASDAKQNTWDMKFCERNIIFVNLLKLFQILCNPYNMPHNAMGHEISWNVRPSKFSSSLPPSSTPTLSQPPVLCSSNTNIWRYMWGVSQNAHFRKVAVELFLTWFPPNSHDLPLQ